MRGVLVFGDAPEGRLSAASLEVAAAGRQLARAGSGPLLGALAGAECAAAAESFRAEFSCLYLLEDPQLRPYTAEAWVSAAEHVIGACEPSIVLFTHTLATRDWVPQLAARLGAALVLDCIGLELIEGELLVTKPVFGGALLAQYALRGELRLATVRSGAFEGAANAGVPARLARLRAELARSRLTVLDEHAPAASGPRLQDAAIVVAGGRGVGGPENWRYIEEAAAALGAAVGCSRPVADAGWVSSSRQVGLSGVSVRPALYLAVGISGALQHMAGVSPAATVVAINIDPQADIFRRARFGVVGDYREVLPAFVERARQLRGD